MKVSIIMPCFKRMDYLEYGLWSLSQQKISYDIETIILNDYLADSGAEEICNKYKDKLNIKYIFIGQRHTKNKIIRRDQGYALNIGVKQAKGKIIILTGNGLFHVTDSINNVIESLLKNKKILSTPKCIFFDNGEIVEYLSKNLTRKITKKFASFFRFSYRAEYAGKLPYWMAMYKKEFINIGGHDEDFVGFGGLDDDLINRLQLNGLKYNNCNAKIIHLYHPISINPKKNRWEQPQWVYNQFLRLSRKDKIIRNENREWGKI